MASAAQRLQAAEQALLRAEDAVTPATRPRAVRVDPIRSTVDLAPARHNALSELQDWLSTELGLPIGRRGIGRNDVLDELVALVLTDQNVAERLLTQLRERPRVRQAQRLRGRI